MGKHAYDDPQCKLFPRMNAFFEQIQNPMRVNCLIPIEREAAWKSWFAFMSSKHVEPDGAHFDILELRCNANAVVEQMQKMLQKLREKEKSNRNGRRGAGRPKGSGGKICLVDRNNGDGNDHDHHHHHHHHNNNNNNINNNSAGSGGSKSTQTTNANVALTAGGQNGTNREDDNNSGQKQQQQQRKKESGDNINAAAITRTEDGKQKLTIRFSPEDDKITRAVKESGHNPTVDLTFKATKKLADICDHFANKWSDAAKKLEADVRSELDNVAVKDKVFLFTLRPNMRGKIVNRRAAVDLEPCIVWDKQILGQMTAVKAYESRGYPDIFEVKYSWRFVPLPPDECEPKRRPMNKPKPKKSRVYAATTTTQVSGFLNIFDDDLKTRTPLPPPEFTMSAFDVGAFVSCSPDDRENKESKKRKLDSVSTKEKGKHIAKKSAHQQEQQQHSVPKEITPESDSMMALRLNAEINGGNRERRARNPAPVQGYNSDDDDDDDEDKENGEEAEEEDDDIDDVDNKEVEDAEEVQYAAEEMGLELKATLPQQKDIEKNDSEYPQWAGLDSILGGRGIDDIATQHAPGEATMNGLQEFLGSVIPKRTVETGPSNFSGIRF